MKVGSVEHKAFQKELSAKWAAMSADTKASFHSQAYEESQAKARLGGSLLNDNAQEEILSKPQTKRLGQKRLDASLSAISSHKAWSQGLRLASHVSALKPELVLDVTAEVARADIVDALSYDAECLDCASVAQAFKLLIIVMVIYSYSYSHSYSHSYSLSSYVTVGKGNRRYVMYFVVGQIT